MASQAYEIAFTLLKKNPEVAYAKVKAAGDKKGVHIFPVVYGRAKREAAPHLIKKKVKKVAQPALDFTTASISSPPPRNVGAAPARKKAVKPPAPRPASKPRPAAKVAGSYDRERSSNGLMAELGELLERYENREKVVREGLVTLRETLNEVLVDINS